MSRLILASNSPRRRQLLAQAGYVFKVVAPPWPEPSAGDLGVAAEQFAEAASYYKARAAASICGSGVILAADTVVAREGRLFGKPENREAARRILGELAGTRHQVITGVTVLEARTGRRVIAHDRTHVYMRPMSKPELEAYLDGGCWRGKAGAYGIQDSEDRFIQKLDGSFTNVVGLPMEIVADLLARFRIVPRTVRCRA